MKIKFMMFWLILFSALTVHPLIAQDAKEEEEDRRIQGYIGYSYLRGKSDDTISRRVFRTGESNKDLNGLNVAGTFYFTPTIGITGDFSAHFDKDDVRIPVGTFGSTVARDVRFRAQTYNYLVGPQIRFTNNSRLTPFARVLFGGQTNRVKIDNFTVGNTNLGRVSDTRTNFAMAVGGGLDVRVNKNFAIRAIQIDYLPSFERDRTNILSTGRRLNGERTDQIRLGFGIVIK
jgi:opacity protein-like surface antigen